MLTGVCSLTTSVCALSHCRLSRFTGYMSSAGSGWRRYAWSSPRRRSGPTPRCFCAARTRPRRRFDGPRARACVCVFAFVYRVLTIPRPEAGGRYTGTTTRAARSRLADGGMRPCWLLGGGTRVARARGRPTRTGRGALLYLSLGSFPAQAKTAYPYRRPNGSTDRWPLPTGRSILIVVTIAIGLAPPPQL